MKSHEEFLKKLKELKETHLPPPPCSDERAATPPLDAEEKAGSYISCFNTNEGQTFIVVLCYYGMTTSKTRR